MRGAGRAAARTLLPGSLVAAPAAPGTLWGGALSSQVLGSAGRKHGLDSGP